LTEWLKRDAATLGVDASLDKILVDFFAVRGFSSIEDVHKFLRFSLRDLTDPSKLKDMDKAVARLVTAFKKQETVCVYGDFDMDGTPALALAVRGLRGLGFKNVEHVQPDRHTDGYGFHAKIAKKFIEDKKVSLFITVDVGITDVDAIDEVNAAGAEVIVTDHHQVQDRIPQALAIVNPNQPDCTAGLGHLCGTGVSFYLMLALRRELKKQNILPNEFDVKTLLDCFAIGTVADLVPLIRENRILVKHGLKVLERTPMIGLRMLLTALKLHDKHLTAQDVAMRFVPKLNSLSRMGADLKPIDLFLVDEPGKAALMVQDLLKNNERRVYLLGEAEELLDSMVAQEKKLAPSLFYHSDAFHKGLVGLLATHLANTYRRPSFVGALLESEEGKETIVGSARAPEGTGLNVFEALKNCEEHLVKFGGHPAAAGFEVAPENADALQTALNEYFVSNPAADSKAAAYYDHEGDFYLVKSFMQWWDGLEPFGFAFAPPVFRMDRLQLIKASSMRGGHLKIQFREPGQELMECVWFSPEDPEFFDKNQAKSYSVLCEPQWNEFMGSRRLQLLVKDIRVL